MLLKNALIKKVGLGLGALLLAAPAFAAPALNSSCSMQEGEGHEIQGVNTDKKYRIASVSKVFTSFWAISRFGADFRYTTTLLVTPVEGEENVADVHIRGTHDPYFDREKLQMLVSELNKLNVKKIRNLTYDEKFDFALNIRSNDVAWSTVLPSHPSTNTVMTSLRREVSRISTGYAATKALAKRLHNVDMAPQLVLQVKNIEFLSAKDYKESAQTRLFYLRSAPLHVLVKEMNSQSNNWAAEMMFKSLGGAEAFAPFMKKELNLDDTQVTFVNGSGNRIDPQGPGVYNEASCEAVVTVIAALHGKMQAAGMGLEDVMAVAGEHIKGSTNTVNSYANEGTANALVAKTGSINPSIALAGLASTGEGDVYFSYLYGTNSRSEWSSARGKIRLDVNKLFRTHDRRKPLDISGTQFLSFDASSKLVERKASQGRLSLRGSP